MTDDADHLPRFPSPVGAEAIEIGELTAGPGVAQPLALVTASIVVGTVALMVLGIQPVLLGALAQTHRVTDAQLGPLATIEVLALAFGSAVGPRWLGAGGMKWKAMGLSLALAAANMGVYLAHSALMLDVLRGIAGLLEGLIMGATIVIMIKDKNPDRLNAIFLGLSTAPQALLAYLLPVWIAPRLGPEGGFVVLAALALVSAGWSLMLKDSAAAAHEEAAGAPVWSLSILVALAAVALQNGAIGGAWAYIELLADQHHFPAQVAAIAVSGGLVFQVAGALAVAAFGPRFDFRAALVVGSLGQTGVIIALALAGSPVAFLVPALCFGLFWLALSPFQVRLLIALDPTRSAATLLTAVSLVGLSIGPSISALGVGAAGVTGAFWLAAGMMAVAVALYVGLAVRAGAAARAV